MIKFKKPTLVTITAPTCSGKSHILNALTRFGLCTRIVSTTTRPARSGEEHGVDYYFITDEQSRRMEASGEFFELIEFNGVRYGVTTEEMRARMGTITPPVVILEPQGLEIYEKKCREHGWDTFKIFVNVPEEVKLERLLKRTTDALRQAGMSEEAAEALLKEHQRRLLSITGPERMWHMRARWDAIVPGDNLEQALDMIQRGAEWRVKSART